MIEWDIWIPKNNNPNWRPDEQTYAIQTGKGHYNSDAYAKVDHAISYSAYGNLLRENELLKQHVDNLKSEIKVLIEKLKKNGIKSDYPYDD